jgi:HTH-type transcriptional regulator/antitoxin HigA
VENMTTIAVEPLEQAWGSLQTLVPIFPIRSEQQYDQALELLHWLLGTVGDDETHPLYELLDTLSVLIEAYEETYYPAPSVTGIDVLKFLIEEHRLTPSDLSEIGNQEKVVALLEGRQELNVRDIRALSERFGLSPVTFF